MDDIYIYIVPLPIGIDEIVMPCADGHTVYLADRLDRSEQIRTYRHAVQHIMAGDFQKENVQEIEYDAHKI